MTSTGSPTEGQTRIMSANLADERFDDDVLNRALTKGETDESLQLIATGMRALKTTGDRNSAEANSKFERISTELDNLRLSLEEKAKQHQVLQNQIEAFEKKTAQAVSLQATSEFERAIKLEEKHFIDWFFAPQRNQNLYGGKPVNSKQGFDVSLKKDLYRFDHGAIKLADVIDSDFSTGIDFEQWKPAGRLSGEIVNQLRKESVILQESKVESTAEPWIYLIKEIDDVTFAKTKIRNKDDHHTKFGDLKRDTINLHYQTTRMDFDWMFLENMSKSDYPFDFETFLQELLRESYVRELERRLTYGEGDTKDEPFGCLNRTVGKAQNIATVNTGNAGALFTDFMSFIDVYKEIGYSQVVTAGKWYMNFLTWLEVIRYTDSDNRPYFPMGQVTPTFLHGRPVVIFDTMPNIANGSLSIMFGDLRDSYISLISPREWVQMDDSFDEKTKRMRWVFQNGGNFKRTDKMVYVLCQA